MKARRWDGCDEADDEVAGLGQECAGAIFPNAFESELELTLGAELEAVLGKRGRVIYLKRRSLAPSALRLAGARRPWSSVDSCSVLHSSTPAPVGDGHGHRRIDERGD